MQSEERNKKIISEILVYYTNQYMDQNIEFLKQCGAEAEINKIKEDNTRDKLKQSIYEKVLEENYYGAFIYMGKQYHITAFSSIFEFIPDNKKYELFMDIYCMSERGLVMPKIINQIFKLRPKDLIESLRPKADDKEYLTIYRGESTHSTKVQKALSWTLKRDTAIWFAERFNFSGIGYLYTAHADINKVIAYITDRNEEEIVIRYRDIETVNREEVIVTEREATEQA